MTNDKSNTNRLWLVTASRPGKRGKTPFGRVLRREADSDEDHKPEVNVQSVPSYAIE